MIFFKVVLFLIDLLIHFRDRGKLFTPCADSKRENCLCFDLEGQFIVDIILNNHSILRFRVR